jgi:DNA polymerase-3 subunit gamma/tau
LIPIPGSEPDASGPTAGAATIPQDTLIKKAATPLAAPTGQRAQRQTPSLKAQLEAPKPAEMPTEAAGNEPERVPAGPRETVTEEALSLAWKQFADDHVAEGSRSLYTTLTAEQPVIDGEQIRFKIHNAIQERDLTEMRTELMDYLRKSLNNVGLQLEVERVQEQEVKKEFLSEREKYDRLVSKNPLLDELRKRLDLDLK